MTAEKTGSPRRRFVPGAVSDEEELGKESNPREVLDLNDREFESLTRSVLLRIVS
jgi:hypothetical protein